MCLVKIQCFSQNSVVYINPEGDFDPEKIKSIAKKFDLDEKNVLNKIFVSDKFLTENEFL